MQKYSAVVCHEPIVRHTVPRTSEIDAQAEATTCYTHMHEQTNTETLKCKGWIEDAVGLA